MAAAVGKRRRRRVSGTAAVGRRRRRVSSSTHRAPRRRTRRVSGTAAVGKTHRRRRRSVGSTSATGIIKQVIPMAVGMAGGVALQHFILRPIEAKIARHMPMAAKFFAGAEVLLGGYVALKAKNPLVRGAGLGIMAGGVQGVAKQFNLYHESPAVQGVGDYTTVRIPVNGSMRDMLSGIINNRDGGTHTSMVADTEHRISDENVSRSNLLAGIYGLGDYSVGEDESENYLMPKGMF